MEKQVWVYPKSRMWDLQSCSVFYGNEKEYKLFMKGHHGKSMKDIMKQTARFRKVPYLNG